MHAHTSVEVALGRVPGAAVAEAIANLVAEERIFHKRNRVSRQRTRDWPSLESKEGESTGRWFPETKRVRHCHKQIVPTRVSVCVRFHHTSKIAFVTFGVKRASSSGHVRSASSALWKSMSARGRI